MDKWLKILIPVLAGAAGGLAHAGVVSPEVLAAGTTLAGALAGLYHSKPGSQFKK